MRQHLSVTLRQHVSTFAYTLMENCHEVYEYAPLLEPVRCTPLDALGPFSTTFSPELPHSEALVLRLDDKQLYRPRAPNAKP